MTDDDLTPRQRSRRTGWVIAIIIVVVIVLLALTCPSREKHEERITHVVNSAVSTVAQEQYGLLGMVGSMLFSGITSGVVEELLTVHDYVIVSIGTIDYDGKTYVVSIGVLSHIYTVNSEVIERKLRGL